ncbi:MAG: hypothetical protein DWP92_05445 [Armatimonadetes bacterium]|nr:MAG: hypothetical protein DWP92_05445 [Armatimonadota bacterium]
MPIVVFILIAGLWAAFLLPSFFDHKRRAPKATTRDFARAQQKLATVASSQPDTDTYIRRHAQVRRQRILFGMGVASVATLVFATWTGSLPWLYLNIAINVSIASYVTLLLTIKQRRAVQRTIVTPITHAPQRTLTAVPDQSAYATDESATVRVIAG